MLAWDRKGIAARKLARQGEADPTFAATDGALDELAQAARRAHAFRILCACAGRRGGGARNSSPGSGPRPTTRSMNSSIWRSTTRRARRRRCKASSTGCAPPKAKCERDMEMARDEVRVMTVHGAKGLEGQHCHPRRHHHAARRPTRSATADAADRRRSSASGRPRAADDVGRHDGRARSCARQDARDEYRRLLYVAMTRAAERLMVCGARRREQDARRLLVPAGRKCDGRQMRAANRPTTAAARCCDIARADTPPADVEKNVAPAAIKPTSVPAWLHTERSVPNRSAARR